MKKILLILALSSFLFAQERVLLHIGRDGKQEAILLGKGEQAQEAVGRLENARTSLFSKPSSANGLVDTLKNYPGVANDASVLTSNFGFTHQDVAFQWFTPQVYGKVKEVWWRNNSLLGDIKKATIRAWYANPKVNQVIPASVLTKYIGTYKDPTDGDGLVTPFKPATGDQWFYKNGAADSTLFGFDPLGTEASKWPPGGLQVELDSGKWQGIKLDVWGDSMYVKLGEPFGFTISNDTKVTDIPPANPVAGARMEILSYPNVNPQPYHSYKFYETGRTSAADKGWYMRGDFEFGMYVVLEYTSIPPTRIRVQNLVQTTLKTTPRPITAIVTDDNPGGGPAGVAAVYLHTKKGALASYDSVLAIASGSWYTAYTPSAAPGDTVYWRIVAYDVEGNRTTFGPRTYVVFKNVQSNLLLYNNAQYSLGNSGANLIYTGGSSKFDRWSSPADGVGEIDDLLALYNSVLVADGSFPSQNIYPSLKKWFQKGTANTKKNLFFSSQDYGCYISPACEDTTFTAGSFEFDYLGVLTLGPQDVGPTNRPYQIVPQPDEVTDYLIKYNSDSSTTLWYYPTFELVFSAYPDAMTIKSGAKALFKNGTGINTLGVLYSGATFNSMFVAFDVGSLQFRGDTSLHNAGYTTVTDPKYQWINDINPLSNSFFRPITEVSDNETNRLTDYSLSQNYPNPFNPTTMISYQIPENNFVNLKVFDLLGRQVAQLMNGEQKAGSYTVTFDAKNVSSGLYFYQLKSGNFFGVKKMMVIK